MSSAPSADLFQPLKADDPAVVGGYHLAAVLGSGGMGKVYLSYTPGGRPIALKVIRPEFSGDAEFRRRFQQEVRAAQRVQGLYTAPVIDSDTEGSQPWLATAYVPGPSLAHAVAQHGGLPLRSVLLLTVGVAEALNVIHGAGIVHRDLKPANVLLASDGPRVIDFGIARAADSTALTSTGVSIGTPAFMAPEQAAAGTITPATDIFALGQIAAYAAIGAPAFGDGPSHAVLYRIVHEDPDLSRLPDELRPLVTRCLSRDPADRPALTEVIELCHAISPDPLRQGEDWLPKAIAGSITERLQLPAPVKPPAPAPVTPTPTERSPQHPAPGAGAPPYPPTVGAAAAAPTQAAPGAPAAPAMPPRAPGATAPTAPGTQGGPGTMPPGYRTPYPGYQNAPGYQNPPGYGPGYRTPPPFHPGGFPPQPPKPKRTGLIVAASIVGAIVLLGVIGSLLPDSPKDNKSASSGGTSSTGGTNTGGSGTGGSTDATDGTQPRTDPKPVSYKNVDMTGNYYLMLADNPPRPTEDTESGVLYGHGDLFYYHDSMFGEDKLGTANGKLVLLNNAQKGSLETCRAETRYTERIGLDQLTNGSQICVLSDAGHIAVATYRGKSGAKDPSKYVTVDLTIWRNAADPKES
ncbi:serine/threonine protein kinase [Streptomyces sp. ISL-36]|uniref:serine/threonine-protein kinase n=1 Tax=Streptomyces sp. ISL-36 TaxID=2819182 RepID=UPI001BEB0DE2|nr:serine/threonine-protein kinase [Streptomyces sp. ISL-36]MBT2440870.1 serine/threonine protein kinase [Streptomyces sp. ISL-36]